MWLFPFLWDIVMHAWHLTIFQSFFFVVPAVPDLASGCLVPSFGGLPTFPTQNLVHFLNRWNRGKISNMSFLAQP